MKERRVWRGSALAAASVLLAACPDNNGNGGGVTQPTPTPSPTLTALTVNPTSQLGGASATLTATISSAAPSTGAAVTLSSNNGAVAVPGSLAIAPGATTGTAPVTTTSVTTATNVTITGSLGGTSQTTTLALEPTAVARFTVVSPSRGTDACQLAAGGGADCDLNGGASSGSGAIQRWNWTLKVGAQQSTFTTTTPTTRPPVGCPLYEREPATTVGNVTFIQMTVELTVTDAAGRTSAQSVNPNVRVFPQRNCGRGF